MGLTGLDPHYARDARRHFNDLLDIFERGAIEASGSWDEFLRAFLFAFGAKAFLEVFGPREIDGEACTAFREYCGAEPLDPYEIRILEKHEVGCAEYRRDKMSNQRREPSWRQKTPEKTLGAGRVTY